MFKKKPILLLDIDGVVSPLGFVEGLKPRSRHVPYSNWAVTDEVANYLSKLSKKVNVIWASNWEKDSLILSEDLHIRSKQYIDITSEWDSTQNWFKETAIKKFIKKHKNTPIAWAEDEAPDYMIQYCKKNHNNFFMMKTNPKTGLTLENLNKIEDFLL